MNMILIGGKNNLSHVKAQGAKVKSKKLGVFAPLREPDTLC